PLMLAVLLLVPVAAAGVGALLSVRRLDARQLTSASNTVFSAAQAKRGELTYESHCEQCHGRALGGREAPALSGAAVSRQWMEDTVNSLFDKIRRTMPADSAGSLTPNEYVDVVAYILQANGFPEGSEELVPDPARLESIRIQRNQGASLPNYAMVRVV